MARYIFYGNQYVSQSTSYFKAYFTIHDITIQQYIHLQLFYIIFKKNQSNSFLKEFIILIV